MPGPVPLWPQPPLWQRCSRGGWRHCLAGSSPPVGGPCSVPGLPWQSCQIWGLVKLSSLEAPLLLSLALSPAAHASFSAVEMDSSWPPSPQVTCSATPNQSKVSSHPVFPSLFPSKFPHMRHYPVGLNQASLSPDLLYLELPVASPDEGLGVTHGALRPLWAHPWGPAAPSPRPGPHL